MSQEIAKTRRLPDHSSGVKYPALAGEAIEKIISRVGGFERAEQVRIIAAVRAYFNTYGEDGFKPSRRESLPVGAQRILDPESP
ncbi:MAG TPA: hypothetical protein VFD36_20690 [Kofleriaceae bacterium]|nr:hypothetical protein [Kofleriaceae bacterium]